MDGTELMQDRPMTPLQRLQAIRAAALRADELDAMGCDACDLAEGQTTEAREAKLSEAQQYWEDFHLTIELLVGLIAGDATAQAQMDLIEARCAGLEG